MGTSDDDYTRTALDAAGATERMLRARIDELEHQLVAYDAAFDGDLALAEQVSPGTFFVRRKHAAARLSPAILRTAFELRLPPGPNITFRGMALDALETHHGDGPTEPLVTPVEQALQQAWLLGRSFTEQNGPERHEDDADFLRWVWARVLPQTQFVSCALPQGTAYHPCVDLAANGRSQPDPVSGRHLTRDETSLPRSGLSGLPRDWTWLVTAWRLEVRGGEGWDCSGLKGSLRFLYNSRPVATRPLSDALTPRDEDLLVVIRGNIQFKFEAEFQRGVTRIGNGDSEPPRLYVFLDVIADQPVV